MSDEGLLLEVPDEPELFASLGEAGILESSTVIVINETVAEGVPAKQRENMEAAKRAYERVVVEPARS